MRTLSLTVTPEQAGRMVQHVLRHDLLLSNALIVRLKRRMTGICVNGKKAFTIYVLRAGDVLTVEIGDPPTARRAQPVAMPLDIAYEDADVLILNKPAGVTVHADSRRPDEITLDHALSFYLPPDAFPHPVSRLDRGTTGLMTYAKSGYIHDRLRRMLHTPAFYREYRALCTGIPDPPNGTIDLPIGFAEGSTYQRAVTPDGAPSITDYEVLGSGGGMSLLCLIPRTGRTHQLRVHLAALGHPLVGDWLYGTRDDARIARPALHSSQLTLIHPLTGEQITVRAPLPEDMARLCAASGIDGTR